MEPSYRARMPIERAISCLNYASSHWNNFYLLHGDTFFKDRHWLEKEFASFVPSEIRTVLEVGCGTGSTLGPLSIVLDEKAHIFACDFADLAVEAVKRRPEYDPVRMTVFVADVVAEDLTNNVPAAHLDAAMMLFVLSALPPNGMKKAIMNVSRTLKVGGRIFFRDYAEGDLAQSKLASKGGHHLPGGDSLYARADNTLAYYFKKEDVKRLFLAGGLDIEELEVLEKTTENRKLVTRMARVYVQGVFMKRQESQQLLSPMLDSSIVMSTAHTDNFQRWPRESIQCDGHVYGKLTRRRPFERGVEEVLQRSGRPSNESIDILCGSDLHYPPKILDESSIEAPGKAEHESVSLRLLAEVLRSCPRLLLGSHVMHIACGADAEPCLEATRLCRMVIATDTSPSNVSLLRQNVLARGHLYLYERIRVAVLNNSSSDTIADIFAELGGSLNLILLALDPNDIEARCGRGEYEHVDSFLFTTISLCSNVLTAARLACHGSGSSGTSIVMILPKHMQKKVYDVSKSCGLTSDRQPPEVEETLSAMQRDFYTVVFFS